MKQQTDKFFRDKLENHQVPAPSAAWDRIEAGLSKKNKPAAYWMKIAASLLVVAVAAYILWPSNDNQTGIAKDSGTPAKVDSASHPKENTPAVIPQVKQNLVAKSNTATEGRPVSKEKQNRNITKKEPVVSVEENKPTEEITNEKNTTEEATTQPKVIIAPAESIQPNTIASVEDKTATDGSIKITINAAESEKFLNKKTLAEATPEEKKTSTLKKLLDKAEDMDPFGDLRQKKNEILALNFRSEKNQRGQNK